MGLLRRVLTDRRNPRTHRAVDLPQLMRDPATPSVKGAPYGVSAYGGDKPYWEGRPRINVAGV